MFNSRQYEWADITLVLGGRDITGIRAIKYTQKIEREALYGKGRYSHSIQSGNVSVEGEIKVTHAELLMLKNSAKGGLLSLSLDALVAYGQPGEGSAIVTDIIYGIRFLEDSIEYKQGDKFAEVTLPFIALRIG